MSKIIVVMGSTGTGKTTLINTLVPEARFAVGHTLKSRTQVIQDVQVPGIRRDITVVDTPGFDDTDVTDAEVLKRISTWLKIKYTSGQRLSGIAYLHRISDNKLGGSSFRQLRMFRELCGVEAFPNVIFITTMWSRAPKDVAERREKELKEDPDFWREFIQRGARMMRFEDTQDSAKAIVEAFFDIEATTLQIQSEMVHLRKQLKDTSAAAEVRARLDELRNTLRRELKATEDAIKTEKNRKDAKAGHQDLVKLKNHISKVEKQLNNLETRWYRKVLRNILG